MNKFEAKKIAQIITNKELSLMFLNAKKNITNWEKVSKVNKGMSIGTTWNILASNFDINKNYHILEKRNMVWEFGDFLPEVFKIEKNNTNKEIKIVHQKPNFEKYEK